MNPQVDDGFDGDRFAGSQWVDHFTLYGYRNLALKLLSQTLRDVRDGKEPFRREAIEWFSYRPGPSSYPQAGLTFEDCLLYSGLRVQLDEFRRQALENPGQVMRLVDSKEHSLRCEQRNELVPPAQTRVGRGISGPANVVWLFGKARPQVELGPEA